MAAVKKLSLHNKLFKNNRNRPNYFIHRPNNKEFFHQDKA